MEELSECDLAGSGVLVTRAESQAKRLCQLITEMKGRPIRFPCMEIAAPGSSERLDRLLADVGSFHMALFISANAVRWGLRRLPGGRLPERLKIAAVGAATARALTDSGHAVVLVPQQGYDSEALLASPELDAESVAGKRILIFRGRGGRELLRDTLTRRGALVEYAEVYQRRCPERMEGRGPESWIGDLDVITATSNMVLDNLFQLSGNDYRKHIQQTPLIVISERMRRHAVALGCRQVMVADGPDDRALVHALCRWNSNR